DRFADLFEPGIGASPRLADLRRWTTRLPEQGFCSMNPAIRLRRLTESDLLFADVLRAQAGWNQTLTDWRRFLRMNPGGCFLAEWGGAPPGTARTTRSV